MAPPILIYISRILVDFELKWRLVRNMIVFKRLNWNLKSDYALVILNVS